MVKYFASRRDSQDSTHDQPAVRRARLVSTADAQQPPSRTSMMDEWGARMNLTAIRDREQQLTKHVLDSLSIRPWLRGDRIADLGSGAGFPGIPLAVVEPARHFALSEAPGTKCAFLRRVAAELVLANVEIVQAGPRPIDPRPVRHSRRAAIGPIADRAVEAGTSWPAVAGCSP
jgi:hypothetical protein